MKVRITSSVRQAVSWALFLLVLDVWLLGRSRLLHAEWLATVPGVPDAQLGAAQGQAREWGRLAAQSYLGLRRVQRGDALPPSVLERLRQLLAGDVERARRLAARMAGTAGVPAGIHAAVGDAVRTVLRLDGAEVLTGQAFRTLPNFNSFRLVDIIERVETGLGVRLDAEDLTLDALHDVDALARLFARVAGRTR